MPIESNRTVGGVAAILFVTGVVSQVTSVFEYALSKQSLTSAVSVGVGGVFGVIGFVALILFFVAMYGFSKDYGDGRIFSYLTTGLIAAIVIGAVAAVVLVGFTLIFGASTLFSATGQTNYSLERSFLPVLPAFAAISLVWIVFNVRALNLLGDKSKVALFRTGAKVLLTGSAVTVAVTAVLAAVGPSLTVSFSALQAFTSLPGGLIQDFAWLLLAMAYFRIQVPAPPTTPLNVAPAPVAPAVYGQAKFCQTCGAANPADAVYCTRCGRKLP